MIPLLSLFADAPTACTTQFFGLIPWFQYLNFSVQNVGGGTVCNLNLGSNGLVDSSTWNQIWLIALALSEDMFRIIGFLAVIFVIWGGFRYITSQGEPEHIKSAQSTIFNALIGLVIAILAAGTVNFIANQLGGTNSVNGLPNIVDTSTTLTNVVNILFGIIGAVALLMLVFGGFKYVTSGGESAKVNSAKNTILYALIGLTVCVLAVAIVNFIVFKLGSYG